MKIQVLALGLALAFRPLAHAQEDPLHLWNATGPKAAVRSFVERVTKPGSPDFGASSASG